MALSEARPSFFAVGCDIFPVLNASIDYSPRAFRWLRGNQQRPSTTVTRCYVGYDHVEDDVVNGHDDDLPIARRSKDDWLSPWPSTR